MQERKHYIDNIRWVTVLVVIFYHVIYLFNTVGVISNIGVTGIRQFDTVLYIIYPWFMPLLFLVAGISARYSIEKRGEKSFIKDRIKRILLPSIAGIFILGWVCGLVTAQYTDFFSGQGTNIPFFIKYIICCLTGIGPLWFLHELFLASLVLMIIRKIEKDRLWNLCSKINIWGLMLLVFAVWGSSHILNTPLIEVYRNGIYIFMFLLGYYLFSHEEITDITVKYRFYFLALALALAAAYTIFYYGKNYTTQECLKGFFTNFFAWTAILAILGNFKAYFNKENNFSKYMTKRNFGFYILHYYLMVAIAYIVVEYLHMPMFLNYIAILVLEILLLPILYELISKIPVIKTLVLGIYSKK